MEGESKGPEGELVTPLPVRKGQSNKRKREISDKKKAAITPSTQSTDTTITDPFFGHSTPINDKAIHLDYQGSHKNTTPTMARSRSSSLSSAPSTPTKPPASRRRIAAPKPPALTHAEALQRVRALVMELNSTRAEYKRISDMYKHLLRDENATPDILDTAVSTTTQRLELALRAKRKLMAGVRPDYPYYPPQMIPELQAAVQKAEADRENWYIETTNMFYLTIKLERDLPRLKAMLEMAKKEEAAARERESVQGSPPAGCQRPIAPSGIPTGSGGSYESSPPLARRVFQGETLVSSPAFSEGTYQGSVMKGIRSTMHPAASGSAFQTPGQNYY
ncbi:hypothetical protein EsH8_X_000447 [Colletotrichum jinshuiense]